jgi:hypothetical protein
MGKALNGEEIVISHGVGFDSTGSGPYTLLRDVERPIDHPSVSGVGSSTPSRQVDGPLSAEPESLFEVEAPRPLSPYEVAA